MKNLILVLITLSITLSGCASKRVLTKNVPADEVARDDAQCRTIASQVQTADYAYRGTFLEGANIAQNQKHTFISCMEGKGYK